MAPLESFKHIGRITTLLEWVMKTAKAKGRTDVYDAALRRKFELMRLANEDPNDPLIRALYDTGKYWTPPPRGGNEKSGKQ